MKRRGYDNKRDAAEPAIVEAFEKAGAKVWRLDQPFDLLVNIGEILLLVECKTGCGGLNPNQAKLAQDWPVKVIRTPEEAVALVDSMRRMAA